MSYDISIPGQTNEIQLRAIEIIATLIPPNGKIVEIGSLFGRTSYAWSKSVYPTVKVYCIDPWENNQGVSVMEKRLGIKYNIEQWRIYTKDCPNAIPMQGYSPKDFQNWDEPIDLFFEDSVHRLPLIHENLTFWYSRLKPNGIACGDDYRPRFPDVINEVENLATQTGRKLLVIEKFWCLLPQNQMSPELEKVYSKLIALKNEAKSTAFLSPYAHNFNVLINKEKSESTNFINFDISIVNNSLNIWTDNFGKNVTISLVFTLIDVNSDKNSSYSFSFSIHEPLKPDIVISKNYNIYTQDILPGNYLISAKLLLIDSVGDVFKKLNTLHLEYKIHPKEISLSSFFSCCGKNLPEDWQSIDKTDIFAAYRLILGRCPEDQDVILRHLDKAKNLTELRQRFFSAPEFFKNNWLMIKESINSRAQINKSLSIDFDITPEQQKQLFQHIQLVWSNLGIKEPHFSVYSHSKFKPDNFKKKDSQETFFKSGKVELDNTLQYLYKIGITPDYEGTAIEWGCGVGRVTRFLAEKFFKIFAYDISLPHIHLAQDYLLENNLKNTDFIHLENLNKIYIPPYSFFYSKIVFQHNPPPLTKYLLNLILDSILPNGIFVLQLVTGIKNYSFSINNYLQNIDVIDNQELHAFPLSELFKILKSKNVYILDVLSTPSMVSSFSHKDNLIICQKR